MINYAVLVYQFMKKHKQPIARYPSLAPYELAQFRIRLIQEELDELKREVENNDLVLIADALADLLYVTFGTAITYGLPIDSIFDEVHRSNMTKQGRMDGEHLKVGKGVLYSPPKIKLIIDQCIRVYESSNANSNTNE